MRGRSRSTKTDSQWLRVALAAAGLGVTLMLASTAAWAAGAVLYVGAAVALIGVYVACAVLILPLPLPQLLADRHTRAFRQQIDTYLVEGHALNARQVTDEPGLGELEVAYSGWEESARGWLSRNASKADSASFEHAIGKAADVLGSFNPQHNALRLKLSWQLDILHELRARDG